MTTIPDVKQAIYDKLKVVLGSEVQVLYAESSERKTHSVWLGDTEISDISPHAFRSGKPRRHEEFSVNVFVQRSALTALDADKLSWRVVQTVESALAEDPKLDDTPGLSWALVERIESNTRETGQGFACLIMMTIECKGSFI